MRTGKKFPGFFQVFDAGLQSMESVKRIGKWIFLVEAIRYRCPSTRTPRNLPVHLRPCALNARHGIHLPWPFRSEYSIRSGLHCLPEHAGRSKFLVLRRHVASRPHRIARFCGSHSGVDRNVNLPGAKRCTVVADTPRTIKTAALQQRAENHCDARILVRRCGVDRFADCGILNGHRSPTVEACCTLTLEAGIASEVS